MKKSYSANSAEKMLNFDQKHAIFDLAFIMLNGNEIFSCCAAEKISNMNYSEDCLK